MSTPQEAHASAMMTRATDLLGREIVVVLTDPEVGEYTRFGKLTAIREGEPVSIKISNYRTAPGHPAIVPWTFVLDHEIVSIDEYIS